MVVERVSATPEFLNRVISWKDEGIWWEPDSCLVVDILEPNHARLAELFQLRHPRSKRQ